MRKPTLIILILVVVAIVARALPGARTIDDAFITFRYSRNIVEGLGFVYNPGVHTLGTTTPLFTLVMAAISKLLGGEDFQRYAIGVSAIADAVSCALIYLIARKAIKNEWIAALPGLLWAISPLSVTFAVGGMETSVNILWMLAATWLYVDKRSPIGIGVCAALGLLTRIDAGFWIAPLLVWQLVDCWFSGRSSAAPLHKRIPYKTWIAVLVVLLPWVIFSVGYFGTPIPNSVTAKRYAYLIEPGSAFVRLLQTYATPFFEFDTFGSIGAMIASILYPLLSIAALIYTARKLPRLLPLLIYPWIYMAIFSVLNPLIFRWYLAPPVPALMLSLVIGVWAVARFPFRKVEAIDARPLRIAAVIVGVIGVVWIATSINGWTLHPDHAPDRPAPKMAWHEIELLYQQMGDHLRNDLDVTPETRVASADIGAIGYFSRATIIDTVGLVTPELTQYYPVDPSMIAPDQNYAIPPRLIADTQPDYLVTMEGFVRNGLELDAEFKVQYEVITSYPFNVYGTAMLLYKRIAP